MTARFASDGFRPRRPGVDSRDRPRRDEEHCLQRALFQWKVLAQRSIHPELEAMFSIDHGVKLHIKSAMNLKARGVPAGIPDVCLPVPRGGYVGLWIELKSLDGELSSSQRAWRQILESYGHCYVVVRRLADAIQAISQYLDGADYGRQQFSSPASQGPCQGAADDGSESQRGQSGPAPTN